MDKLIEKDGKFYKQAKVVMLPTKEGYHKKDSICKYIYNNRKNQPLILSANDVTGSPDHYQHYHLYIIDDSEINKEDLFIDYYTSGEPAHIRQCIKKINKDIYDGEISHYPNGDGITKIIASTNTPIKEIMTMHNNKVSECQLFDVQPLPKPSKSFIEAYIKEYNKGIFITDILVEVILLYKEEPLQDYKKIEHLIDFNNKPERWSNKLKLSFSNEIIIKRAEPKVYTQEQLLHFVHEAWVKGALQYQNPKKEQSYTDFIKQILKY